MRFHGDPTLSKFYVWLIMRVDYRSAMWSDHGGRTIDAADQLGRELVVCRNLLVYCSLAPTVGVTWPRQSGISGPRGTAPAEVRGGASFSSTAAAGSAAGAFRPASSLFRPTSVCALSKSSWTVP